MTGTEVLVAAFVIVFSAFAGVILIGGSRRRRR